MYIWLIKFFGHISPALPPPSVLLLVPRGQFPLVPVTSSCALGTDLVLLTPNGAGAVMAVVFLAMLMLLVLMMLLRVPRYAVVAT